MIAYYLRSLPSVMSFGLQLPEGPVGVGGLGWGSTNVLKNLLVDDILI